MATVVLDESLGKRLQAERAATGADRYDEVWEGTYMMAPMPNNEHQKLVSRLTHAFEEVFGDGNLGNVFPGVNVSDRVEGWEHNYRVPDVAVFLNDCPAVDQGSFWHGGPDFAVEIVSPGDQSRDKLEFYASVGTRELLVVDRDPWQLELYRLDSGVLRLAFTVSPNSDSISSDVLGLTFTLLASDEGRPIVQVADPRTGKSWQV